jgi:hypothetical protein
MSTKVVHVPLTEEGIDSAIEELKRFQKWIEDGTKKLIQLMGEKGAEFAQANYDEALYAGTNDVKVTAVVVGDNKVEIRADGSAVLFIEFGTGINNPNSHPDPLAANYPHGQFGYKLGQLEKGWRYPEKNGGGDSGLAWPDPNHEGYLKTQGNPANMSLYDARTQLEDEYLNLVREAFGTYA